MTSNSFFIPTGSKKYTMRWNYWEAQSNHENSESKKIKFATDLMHNHDYHLLTACVLGSGYNTDMYKIEDVPKRLSVGDPIDLIHLGEHNLKQGTAMFMEANTEFHSQKLPVEASVTVNIMINSCFGEQYCLSEDDNSFIVSNILKTNETRREKISKAVER
ncbi:hypothetical protein QNE75_004448, partial [Vibrio vulnificus]|nr:hypothetical protein [Vibrio vulnificus]